MPSLYPDMAREQYEGSDDFIYAAPVTKTAWDHLAGVVSEFTPVHDIPFVRDSQHGFVIWRTLDNDNMPVTVLLRSPWHTDEQMLEAAASIRLLQENADRIYCVPFDENLTTGKAVLHTTGAPKRLSVMYDLLELKEKE